MNGGWRWSCGGRPEMGGRGIPFGGGGWRATVVVHRGKAEFRVSRLGLRFDFDFFFCGG